jgi:RNA polymerase sigma factor for flagellar operon FliA
MASRTSAPQKLKSSVGKARVGSLKVKTKPATGTQSSAKPMKVKKARKRTITPKVTAMSSRGAKIPARRGRGGRPKINTEWPSPRKLKPGSPVEAELVQKYIPLVRTVVGRLAMTLPPHVDGEDLFSAGLMGLLNAVRQYNPAAGTSFETYARLRIRGAVLDELRRMDWVPRSVHSKARKVQRVMQGIEQAKGRMATEQEMAEGLNLTVPEYQQWLEEIRPATFVCLDASSSGDMDDSNSQYECFADARQENPLDGTFRQEVSGLIADRIKQLPEMQRKVLALYYFEDLRLREIAEAFGLTESRICQIHAQAILAIKSHLQRVDSYFA